MITFSWPHDNAYYDMNEWILKNLDRDSFTVPNINIRIMFISC